MRQALGIFSLLLIMCLYQNMDFVSAEFAVLQGVDEQSRSQTGREILGEKYHDSVVDQAREIPVLSQYIYNELRNRLPQAYKGQALGLSQTLLEEADQAGIDPMLVLAVIAVESRFRPKARGSSGELGLMQIMPSTARWIAKKNGVTYRGPSDLLAPKKNLILGIRYLSYLRGRFQGQGYQFLSAYNMGARNVRRLLAQNTQPRIYADKVLFEYRSLYSQVIAARDPLAPTAWEVAGR